MYGISTKSGWKTSADVSATLNPEVEYQLAHRVSIRELERNSCSYSNQDGDILGSALAATSVVTTPDHEKAWVAHMLSKLDSQDWLAIECEICALAVLSEREMLWAILPAHGR